MYINDDFLSLDWLLARHFQQVTTILLVLALCFYLHLLIHQTFQNINLMMITWNSFVKI